VLLPICVTALPPEPIAVPLPVYSVVWKYAEPSLIAGAGRFAVERNLKPVGGVYAKELCPKFAVIL
jgi:hypothetical protein